MRARGHYFRIRRAYKENFYNNLQQKGAIVWGGGLNAQTWINDARSKYPLVKLCRGHAEFWG